MSLRAMIAVTCTTTALLGCASSPPTHFYALNAEPPALAAQDAAADSIPIRLEPVSLPSELDRLQWVLHEGNNRVVIDDERRWTAPLEDQVRQVLSSDLALRLPTGMADPAEALTADPRRLLTVSFPQLQVDTDCTVTAQADWVLKQPSGDSAHGHALIRQSGTGAGACADAVAAALSHALAALSEQMAIDLRQQPSLRAPRESASPPLARTSDATAVR